MSGYYTGIGTNSLDDNNPSTNTSDTWGVGDERSEFLEWLSPLDPWIRHQDIQARRISNVGKWVLETSEFQSWLDNASPNESDKATLFCYGNPGVGKTYISSLVIDSLLDKPRGQSLAVAGFYLSFAAPNQSPTNILGALLKQLVRGLENVPREIVKAFQDQKKIIGGRKPQLDEIVKMLQNIPSLQRTFICVDALDECAVEQRVEVLDSLQKILRKSPGSRLFLTGRPHIRGDIEKRLGGRVSIANISLSREDIIGHLRARLDEDTIPDAMDDSLRANILKIIPEKNSEIFLSVSLNIEAILGETTISHRRKKLSAMKDGSGLWNAYGATLERVKSQSREKARFGMAALMWISHSERVLSADELCHALAIQFGPKGLSSDDVPSIDTLSHSCLGLLVVDKETSTARLVHSTLQDYLSARPELFRSAHSIMAETCLTYLLSHQVKSLPNSNLSNPMRMPFLGYSSIYWGVHAKRELSDRTKDLALSLLGNYDGHISAKFLLKHIVNPDHFEGIGAFSSFTGLHCASFFGISEVVAALIKIDGCDINQRDCMGNVPLMWAAMNGNEDVIKILLQRGDVDPDRPDDGGQTPLSWASKNGHEGLVRLLLQQKYVNADRPGFDGRAPLAWAAGNGHEGIVKMLLDRADVNPDRPDYEGLAPLSRAAKSGHEKIVKMLLDRTDVNPDRPDTIFGQTPLSWASKNGHEGPVKLLLQRGDVNPDRPDTILGHTPLWWAAQSGYERLVMLLLQREEVDPDRPGFDGRTPLSSAAWGGYEEVVNVLLRRGDVSPNKVDTEGQTPLSHAAMEGHEGVVKMLLERGDVDPDRADMYGQTPASWAARNGHEVIEEMLIQRRDVNNDRLDKHGQTPPWWSAVTEHEAVVNLPREQRDDTLGRSNNTPPPCTTSRKRKRVEELLPPESRTPQPPLWRNAKEP